MRKYEDVVTMYLLTECDMKCKFCYASKDLGRMSYAQACGAIDYFASIGATKISLTGGEVLMHPDVVEITKHAFEKRFEVNFFTSGSLLTEAKLDKIAPYLKWITLSLDGPEAIDIEMGRSKIHYENTINALIVIKKKYPEINVRLVTVVTSININYLQNLGKILIEKDATPDYWRLKQMVPIRRAKENKEQLGVNNELFTEKTEELIKSYSDKIKIKGTLAEEKTADIMIIHPDGSCTTTCANDEEYYLKELGNIFANPDEAVNNWFKFRSEKNADHYQGIWDKPQK